MSKRREDFTDEEWQVLKGACYIRFEAGRSNVFVQVRTPLDMDEIERLREDYEREMRLEPRKQYEEDEMLRGDNA